MLFLANDFDGYSSFSCVSPLIIDEFDAKKREGKCHFLYSCEKNQDYVKNAVDIYNSRMKNVGKIILL